MPGKHVYEYALIRFVPKVERGECINVGVILFSKSKNYLDVKFHLDVARLTALDKEVDVNELREYLHAWELICQGSPAGNRIAQLDQAGRFRWLTATRSTIIQSSEVHPGLCDHPESVLEDLFSKYVL